MNFLKFRYQTSVSVHYNYMFIIYCSILKELLNSWHGHCCELVCLYRNRVVRYVGEPTCVVPAPHGNSIANQPYIASNMRKVIDVMFSMHDDVPSSDSANNDDQTTLDDPLL